MTPYVTLLGIVLIVVAIPLGLMVTPLAIGILLVWFAMRRLESTLELPTGEPA